jgi:CHAT domain-containing protein
MLHAAQGRFDDAGRAFDKDRRIVRQYVTRVLPMLTATQQLSYLRFQEERDLAPALSLGYFAKDHNESLVKSADWLLNGKAIAHQVMAESTLHARGSKEPAVAKLLQDLEVVRRKLSRLTIIEDKQEYERLNQEEQKLVVELQQRGSRLASSEPWVEFNEFCKHLPEDSAFIDIVRFQPINFKPGAGQRTRDARYVAWITLPSGKVALVDLGQAHVIDAMIQTVIKSFEEAPKLIRAQGEPIAAQKMHDAMEPFAKQVLHPLLTHIGRQKRWILCPDGDLWLVPWNALPLPGKDPKKITYAVEKHTICYVTSGRDLVAAALPKKKAKAGPPVIFADADFNLDKKGVAKQVAQLRGKDGQADNLRSGALGAIMRGNVKRLEFSAAEASAVAPSLKVFAGVEPEIYMDEKAIKDAVRAVRNPRVLLLSTHGFCLPRSKKETSVEDNPLLRCGLLFAGCNDKQAREQGIMTGLEVLDMDLRCCELVVLSACQTGLGEARDGEGVAGLRQCFQLAGADAVVASLWEVPDLPTAQLMKKFFEVLAKNNDKAEALAEAQRFLIKARSADRGAAHPFVWAAFTLTGHHR